MNQVFFDIIWTGGCMCMSYPGEEVIQEASKGSVVI